MILEYFIPGYVFIIIFTFFTSRKTSTPFLWQSIVISYILKALLSILHTKFLTNIIFSWSKRILILILVSIILSFFTIFLSESKKVKEWISKINHKTPHEDVWLDIIDYSGTTIRCVCNDGTIYCGKLRFHEEKGLDSWFVLEDYIIEEDDSSYGSEGISFPTKLAVNLKNVKRIELFYEKDKEQEN